VTKGLHVVRLSLAATMHDGAFTVLGNGVTAGEAVRLCLEREPACVAIDAPPGWPVAGNARGGERALRQLGIQLYATPSDPRKQRSPFYGWMKVGFEVFKGLSARYPLYRKGRVGRHALEVFPHATAVSLAGRHRPGNVRKAAWRKQILAEQGFDTLGLTNADCIDAALAAVTAAYALRGNFSAFGDPAEGVIAIPHAGAADRFRLAKRGAGGGVAKA
jgi:predicted RNase H-like nuclease